MRFGLSFGALYAPAAELAWLGADAEAGGFDTLWMPDSPMLYRDPYATLALLARDTRHARLGTLATNPLTRHGAVTANAILTVHELSGGRAILGIATGDSAVRRVGAAPVRLADLERAVGELKALLRGEAVTYAGGGFGIRFARAPAPPVYVVATGLRAAEVAGRVADGVVLNVGLHPAVLGAARERIEAGARAAGRRPADLAVVAFFFCAITGDPDLARERLKPSVSWFCQRFPGLCELAGLPLDGALRSALGRFEADYARYDLVHSDQWAQAVRDAAFLPADYVAAFALGGTAGDVAARLAAVRDLGFETVAIRPPSPEDWRPTVRTFMTDVIPVFTGRRLDRPSAGLV
jgi:5,10-methylenetetrahydromethanopterin reductase